MAVEEILGESGSKHREVVLGVGGLLVLVLALGLYRGHRNTAPASATDPGLEGASSQQPYDGSGINGPDINSALNGIFSQNQAILTELAGLTGAATGSPGTPAPAKPKPAPKPGAGTPVHNPKPKPAPKPAPTRTYTVKKGDTLGKIAVKLHTTVDHLVKLNHIQNKNLIFPGQVLRY